MRFLKLSVLALLLVGVIAPLTISAQGDASSLVIAFAEAQPGTLDPAAAQNTDEFQVLRNVCEGLLNYDPETLEPVAGLAESWEISEDGTVYTFALREGVTFSDGSALDANDVKYSLDRLARPETGTSYTASLILGNVVGWSEVRPPAVTVGEGTPTPEPVEPATSISGVEVIDDSTVQITLAKPQSSFLNTLTLPGGFVLPEGSADSGDLTNGPICTGPYAISEVTAAEQVVLTANASYWGGAPAIQQVTIRVIPEQSVKVIEYEAGNLDIVTVPAAELPRIREDADLSGQLVEVPTQSVFHLRINLNDPVLGNAEVRRALSLAIDRQTIIDTVLQGQGVPAQGIYPPGVPAYDPDFQPFPYDPDQARQILADNGYPDGVEVSLRTGQIEQEVRILNAIAQTAAPAGFNIVVNSTERSLWDQDRAACNLSAASIAWGLDYPDAENTAQLVLAGSSGSRINCGYGDYENVEEVQSLYDEGLTAPLGEERNELFRQLQQIAVAEQVVVIPIYHGSTTFLVNDRVEGSPIDTQGVIRFANITLGE